MAELAHMTEITEANEKLKLDNKKLRSKLKKAKENSSELEGKIESLKETRKGLSKKATRLQKENKTLKAQIQTHETQDLKQGEQAQVNSIDVLNDQQKLIKNIEDKLSRKCSEV